VTQISKAKKPERETEVPSHIDARDGNDVEAEPIVDDGLSVKKAGVADLGCAWLNSFHL